MELSRRRWLPLGLCLALLATGPVHGQTGSAGEPVRYVGGVTIDPRPHEGRLRPAVGASSHQVVRVNRTDPEVADGHGWTYSHAPALAYWRDRFWLEYLSNPVGEHYAPGQTLVATSTDGRRWSRPEVVFPPYRPPPGTELPKGSHGYMMHQRMGFYVAPNDRLLVLAFYGHAEDPFKEGGIGRVVREAHADGTYGPIYFIRYSSHADWNESNTSYPQYERSEDAGFVDACRALLANRLVTLQWWDEDRGLDGFYSVERAGSALSYYHRADGQVVALWKFARAALSADGGKSFSTPVRLETLIMSGGKVWGQRTDDGRYAIAYNPIDDSEHRYPLVVVSGDDGIIFDDMLFVHGEVPPRRFYGRYKDFGPQYVRGIAEGNGDPPGRDLWLAYSVNKEDVWVSRVPLPIRSRVTGAVHDTFDALAPAGNVPAWNIYDGIWAPVGVVEASGGGRCLELRDEDPFDYARAVRVFEEGTHKVISFRVRALQEERGRLEIDVVDRFGNRPLRVAFAEDGHVRALDGHRPRELRRYDRDRWHRIRLEVEVTVGGSYSVSIDGDEVLRDAALAHAVLSVERISFRTGPYRDHPTRRTETEVPVPDLEGADTRVPAAVFQIDDLEVSGTVGG